MNYDRRVALLAEGVDRNKLSLTPLEEIYMSPSSRRAWIEMECLLSGYVIQMGRPPRGGRG